MEKINDIIENLANWILRYEAIYDIFIAISSGILANLLFSSYSSKLAILLIVIFLLINIVLRLFSGGDIESNISSITGRTAKAWLVRFFSLICVFSFIVSLALPFFFFKSLNSDKTASYEMMKHERYIDSLNDSLIVYRLEKISSEIDSFYIDVQYSINRIYERINEIEHKSN